MEIESNALRRPLEGERESRLAELLAELDVPSLQWVSGYVAGLAAERSRRPAVREASGAAAAATAHAEAATRALILYASQTGNGRRVAERLGAALTSAGLGAEVVAAGDFNAKRLAEERLVYFVASTHGDGDAPDDGRALMEWLLSRRAPRLERLAFAVLALGDSSYPKFCETGRQLDERLAGLGARRLAPRVDCDVDIDSRALPWIDQAVTTVRAETRATAPRLTVVPLARAVTAPPPPAAATREHPVEAELLVNQRISAEDAGQDVRHLEIALPEGRLDYEPGDALGLWLDNPTQLVDRLIEVTGLQAQAVVSVDGVTLDLRTWLTTRREVTRPGRPLIAALGDRCQGADLRDLQVIDLLQRFPAAWEAEALVRALQPLSPRLYSIASSRREVGDEAHLAVAVVDYEQDGERRIGAASWSLSQLAPGARLRAFLEPNACFRLPADATRDVIMIGPGTGVAPFRGFLQARIADGAPGRNWLFFGARRREREFLYQLEWQAALKQGHLHRLDVAFSRDQAHKVYVQDRMREQGAELFSWLEGGAHLYVCGDATQMAPDVEAALLDIIAVHGRLSTEQAREYLNGLIAARRYARDVY